jgi:hypothetical protein
MSILPTQRMEAIMLREFGAIPTHVTDGSVVIHLKSVDGDIISRLTDGIRREQFVRLIEELFSCHEANSNVKLCTPKPSRFILLSY